jgi:hypothetical protein
LRKWSIHRFGLGKVFIKELRKLCLVVAASGASVHHFGRCFDLKLLFKYTGNMNSCQ